MAGRSERRGISLIEAVKTYGDESTAEQWFIQQRWPNGVRCPRCEGDRITTRENRKPMPFHCKDCRKYFSVRTNSVLQHSNIPLHKWAMAYYLFTTNLKGVSSMKLRRDLDISQKAAWHLAHRIRETWKIEGQAFAGPVEADETYVGGSNRNRHKNKKVKNAFGRSTQGKTVVLGLKDRATNQVKTEVATAASGWVLKRFVEKYTKPDAIIYTDEWMGYRAVERERVSVVHSTGEYVRGDASTNGIESLWASVKRGIYGTYHHVSFKHLHRYTAESEGRHNNRPLDTADQMSAMVRGSVGKRLRYKDLVNSPIRYA